MKSSDLTKSTKNADLPKMMGSFERVRLAAARMGHTMLELAEWSAASDPEHDSGERLMRLERYEEASACFRKLASDLKSRSGSRGRYVRALLALAECQRKLGQRSDAGQNAETARDVLMARNKPCSELAACLDLLGSLREDAGDHDEARKLLREAIDVEEKVIPLDPLALTLRYRRFAKALAGADQSESRAVLDRAVDIAEKRLGTHSPVTADCLMDLGQFQISQGEKDAGIAAIERAIDIHRHTHGSTSAEVTRDLECLASACHMAGDLEKAVHYYERAVSIRERQVGGSPADLAVLFMALADAHTLLGNDAPAMELLQQAVGKLTGCDDGHLAWALEGLGVSYSRSGRFDDAISCYRKARVLWEKHPGENQEMLEANALHMEQAMSYAPAATGAAVPSSFFSRLSFKAHEASQEPVEDGVRPSPAPHPGLARPRRRHAYRDARIAGAVEAPAGNGSDFHADVAAALTAGDAFPGGASHHPSTGPALPPQVTVFCVNPEAVPDVEGPVTAIISRTPFVTGSADNVQMAAPVPDATATGNPVRGTPAAPRQKTLQLVVVGSGNNPGATADAAVTEQAAAVPVKLSGWDELAFDLVELTAPSPNRAA